ncbi:putative PGG domain-containing protein [Medicago truncatula]|uniref:Putative PGG domain-containing protein n=1 Tax=Medicago truncatula TaxID=3880 RepID=I3SPC3_MEDTR|nr:unknown [Medicago truncatula]RHN39382.1 putative PGG domain-containing protein [Medicago truncatula]
MSIIPQQNPSKDNKWLDDMKGSISLTASLIATLTFSLATNPPGGVVQASLDDSNYCSTILNTRMEWSLQTPFGILLGLGSVKLLFLGFS